MVTVARLHPRLWDGRRLLQFLTGLALVALAFLVPALSSPPEAPEPAPVVTVVDAPAPGAGLSGRIAVPDAAASQDAALQDAAASQSAASQGAASSDSAAFPGIGAADGAAAEPCDREAVLGSWAGQRTVTGRAPPVA